LLPPRAQAREVDGQRLDRAEDGGELDLLAHRLDGVVLARHNGRQVAKLPRTKNDLATIVRYEPIGVEAVRARHRAVEDLLDAVRLDRLDDRSKRLAIRRAAVAPHGIGQALALVGSPKPTRIANSWMLSLAMTS